MAIERMVPGTQLEDPDAGPPGAVAARSTAMWLMPIAALVEALVTINDLLSIGFIPPLVLFLVLLSWQ